MSSCMYRLIFQALRKRQSGASYILFLINSLFESGLIIQNRY